MDILQFDRDLPDDVSESLAGQRVLGVDTETSGLDWRTDRIEMCQVFAPGVGTVIVRRVRSKPTNLARVLGEPSALKVFHFAPFDIRFLMSQWGLDVRSIACTKAASKMLDPHLPSQAHSLAPLVSREFNVVLDKGAVRVSDWGADALTPEQLAYAAGDVRYLPSLFERQLERLRESGRDVAYRTVCDYMLIDAQLDLAGVPNPLSY